MSLLCTTAVRLDGDYAMAFFGMVPFGSLAAGWLGDRIGAPATVELGGVATLVAVAIFARALPALRREARPVYRARGIIEQEPP